MLRNLFTLLLCFFTANIFAQPLSIYTNMQRDMMVFDNGMIRKIDFLQPIKIKTGRTAIPYIDNSQNFKIYFAGASRKINIGFTNNFEVSDNLLAYENASILNVFDNGKITELTARMGQFKTHDGYPVNYQMGDSVIVFLDGIRQSFKAYYNGNIIPIENFLASDALHAVRVSDNMAGYVNYANQFYILYLGKQIPVEEYLIESFDVGRNTIAYIDINRHFKVFYKGAVRQLENFAPEKYIVGDDLIAYVSNDGYFKIYHDDSVYNIGFFRPEFQVKDNMVTYTDAGGYFKVFYKGDITTLETMKPNDIQMKYHSIVYRNVFNVWRMFSYGELYDVTSSQPEEVILDYDVLQYRISNNMYRFFYKGKDF